MMPETLFKSAFAALDANPGLMTVFRFHYCHSTIGVFVVNFEKVKMIGLLFHTIRAETALGNWFDMARLPPDFALRFSARIRPHQQPYGFIGENVK